MNETTVFCGRLNVSMSSMEGLENENEVLRAGELHRRDLCGSWMTSFERGADLRELDTYAAKFDEIIGSPNELDRAVMQELLPWRQYI